jgi:hypothetical protein
VAEGDTIEGDTIFFFFWFENDIIVILYGVNKIK